MTKADMIEFLRPFTDEVELRVWNGHVWAHIKMKAEYSARLGTTTIFVTPEHDGTQRPEEV